MESKISVIVPVYNIEKYLERCIESIINQEYYNLEIILVNDGSTDHSGELCDLYAQKDKRIKVIHKKNGGLSDARNAGLNNATGDYIAFVDSDDYIHKDMFEVMFKVIKEKDLSIVECNYKKTYELLDSSFHEKTNVTPSVTIFTKRNAVINAIMDHQLKNVVTNKLYKKELWKKVRFPKGKVFEDVATTYKIMHQCERVGKIENEFYYYFQRDGSIVNTSSYTNKLVHCSIIREILEFIKKEYPEAMPLCCLTFHFTSMAYLQYVIAHRKQIKESNQVINDLVDMILTSEYCMYYAQDEQDFTSLCKEILLSDFDELAHQRARVKIKLKLLENKSLWGFYLMNLVIINTKHAIARIKSRQEVKKL